MAGWVDIYRNLKLNSLLLNSLFIIFIKQFNLHCSSEYLSLREFLSEMQLPLYNSFPTHILTQLKQILYQAHSVTKKILVNRELKLPSGFSYLSKMPCSAKLTPLKTQKMRNPGINQQNLNCDPLEVSVPGITGILSRGVQCSRFFWARCSRTACAISRQAALCICFCFAWGFWQ